MKPIKENYEAVKKIVCNSTFALTPKSEERFCKFLDNQVHNELWKKVAESPDKRLFLDYAGNSIEELKKFNSTVYYSGFTITPESYKNNKTTDGRKVIKALRDYYLKYENCKDLINTFTLLRAEDTTLLFQAFPILFPAKYEKYGERVKAVRSVHFDTESEKLIFTCLVENDFNEDKEISFKKKFQPREYASKCKTLVEGVLVLINTKLLSVKDRDGLKVCFSLNYADWLLASTNNNWTSCLSLYSNYGYWKGLPGLVCDPNRMMMFVTNMEEKSFPSKREIEEYGKPSDCVVTSYNMIQRLWLVEFKDQEGKPFIHSNLCYPRKEAFDVAYYLKQIGIDVPVKMLGEMDNSDEVRCANNFPVIWHNDADGGVNGDDDEWIDSGSVIFSSSIYEDGFIKKVEKLTAEYSDDEDKYYAYYDMSDDHTLDSYCMYAFNEGSVDKYRNGNYFENEDDDDD